VFLKASAVVLGRAAITTRGRSIGDAYGATVSPSMTRVAIDRNPLGSTFPNNTVIAPCSGDLAVT
jgi:hypothetical protein